MVSLGGDRSELAFYRAKIIVSLIINFNCCDTENLPVAQLLYDIMHAMASHINDMPELALNRANAAVNLIINYIKAENLPAAQKLYDDMALFGYAPEITQRRAWVATVPVMDYGKAGNFLAVQKLYDDMIELDDMLERDTSSLGNPLEMIKLARVWAAFFLISEYGNNWYSGDTKRLLSAMRELHDDIASVGNMGKATLPALPTFPFRLKVILKLMSFLSKPSR